MLVGEGHNTINTMSTPIVSPFFHPLDRSQTVNVTIRTVNCVGMLTATSINDNIT